MFNKLLHNTWITYLICYCCIIMYVSVLMPYIMKKVWTLWLMYLISITFSYESMPTKFSLSFLYDFYDCNTLAPAVMAAEIVQYYLPQLIQLHNYTPASSSSQKKENWLLLNRYTQVTAARRLCMVSGAVANLTSPGKPRTLNFGFFCYLMRSVYKFPSFPVVPQVTDLYHFCSIETVYVLFNVFCILQ